MKSAATNRFKSGLLAFLACAVAGQGAPDERGTPDLGRRQQYLFGYNDPEKHRELLSSPEIWPGFPKARVGSGILMDIVGGANEFIRNNASGLPQYSSTGLRQVADCLRIFANASVRPNGYLDSGAKEIEALIAEEDTLRAEGKADVILIAVPFEELTANRARPGVPDLSMHRFYCAAMTNSGEEGKPLTLEFPAAGLIAGDDWTISSITVQQGYFTGTIPFPGQITLPRLDKDKLIRVQANGPNHKPGILFIDPEQG